MSLSFKNKTYSDTILYCSVGYDFSNLSHIAYEFNDDGPVYGPNGQLELDPDNYPCVGEVPVFATCKNNCPGGELFYYVVFSSKLFCNN